MEENNAPLVFGDLNKNICQECGLALKIHSYEKVNPNTENEKIKIKLFCQNLEHKQINEFTYEEYKFLVDEYFDKIGKCIFCDKIFLNTNETPFYCYNCRKIMCKECLNNKHEKEHKNIFKYEDLKDKCLVHPDNNDIKYYCITCKQSLCKNCVTDLEHVKKHDIKEIRLLMEDKDLNKNIELIEQEQIQNKKYKELLLEKLRVLDIKLSFNELLLKEKHNYFHLISDINDKINDNLNELDKNRLNIIEKEIPESNYKKETPLNSSNYTTAINIIYHDENIKYGGMEIISDCQKIQKETNCSLILSNDLVNLNLLLNNFKRNNIKSKFIIIINGSSADNTINFIKKYKYTSLFICGIIYTANLNKYLKIKEKHSDFIETICIDNESLIIFIKTKFSTYKDYNEQFYINKIMNIMLFNEKYLPLYKEISNFYGDETEKSFSSNFSEIESFVKSGNYTDEEKNSLLQGFKIFSEITKKNYKQIIIKYLKDYQFSGILNSLLMKQEISTYKKIGYFAGNLMHSLVQYGKIDHKAINSGNTFYKGMTLSLVEVLEYLKNRNSKITFPYFLSMTTNKDLAEVISKRRLSENERKKKEQFSVIMKISYLYDDGYEPSVINLEQLAQYPDEEDYILLPFTFLKMEQFNLDSNKYILDMEFKIIGKKEILEYNIKDSKQLFLDKKQAIMYSK